MAESEAQRRVQAALSARAQAEQQYQDDWETADKPTTVNGAGVVRQLGAQPLESSQLLSNTTAGAGVPIAGAAVPGGIVGDWVPRMTEPPQPTGQVKRGTTIILVRIKKFKTLDGLLMHYYEIGLVFDGRRYIKIGSEDDIVDWRSIEPPPISAGGDGTFLTGEFNLNAVSIVNPSATPGFGPVSVAATYISKAFKIGSYIADFSFSSTFPYPYPGTPYGIASIAFVYRDPPLQETDRVMACSELSGSTSGENLASTFDYFFDTEDIYDEMTCSLVAATEARTQTKLDIEARASLNVADVKCLMLRSDRDETWLQTTPDGWIVWHRYLESQGASFVQDVLMGFAGNRLSITETRVYAKRVFGDATIEYYAGDTYLDMIKVESDPLIDPFIADFYPNPRSTRLHWDSDPAPLDPDTCSASVRQTGTATFDTRNIVTLQTPVDDVQSFLTANAGRILFSVARATSGEDSCDLGSEKEITRSVTPVLEGSVSIHGFAYYD